MSIRSNRSSVSPADARRVAKQEAEARKFTNVAAYVKPDVPLTDCDAPELSARESADADLLDFLDIESNSKETFVDQFRDFSKYNGMGFNGEVQQELCFTMTVTNQDGKKVKKFFSRFLGAQDGPDTGLVFNPAPAQQNGFPSEHPNGTPEVGAQPIGRWVLERSPECECAVTRVRVKCQAEIDGKIVDIPRGIVYNLKGESPYCLLVDLDPNTLRVTERVPVDVDIFHETEEAQIVEMGGKHYAYRNILGTLRIEDFEGNLQASYPVVNYEPSTIIANREAHAKKVEAWCSMSAQARRDQRFSPGIRKRRPNTIKSECHLLNQEGAGRNPYLIEVKQDDEGRWHQVVAADNMG